MTPQDHNLVITLKSDSPELLKNDLILAVLHAIKLNMNTPCLASLQSVEVLQQLLKGLNADDLNELRINYIVMMKKI